MTGPDALEAALNDAERLLQRRDFRAAHALCLDVLKRDARRARAYQLLGILATEHLNFDKALVLFDKALELGDEPRSHAMRAKCLTALSRPREARAAAARAAAFKPDDPLTLDTIGVAFARAGDHARAAECFRQAAARDPTNASYLYNLGAAEQFVGDFDAAADAYARVIARDPGHYKAYSSLVSLARQTRNDNHVAALEAAFARARDDADATLHLGHALAKTLEDFGDLDAALEWLKKAKEPKRRALVHRVGDDEALFKAAARTVDLTFAGAGHPSRAPIFVVGLPRTGTTLIDRILSSHSRVASAGELTDFALLIKRAAGTPSNLVLDVETLEAAGGLDMGAIGAAYETSARRVVGEAERFVDKMPLNFFYAALILAALPNARIIRLKRDPMDAALSNYRQLFATSFSYYNYAYDLENTGRYVALFETLMARWRDALPADRYMEVGYEDLVADLEGETRRLLAFCDLEWDPNCLKFHENAAPVATASSVQVRAPIHSRSVGRWRRYGTGLDPLKKVMSEAGLLTE